MPLEAFLGHTSTCIGIDDVEANDCDHLEALQICEQENTNILPEQIQNLTKHFEDFHVGELKVKKCISFQDKKNPEKHEFHFLQA